MAPSDLGLWGRSRRAKECSLLFEDAKPHLETVASSWKALDHEKGYPFVFCDQFSPEWKRLLDSVGKSLLGLYRFHRLLLTRHPYFKDCTNGEERISRRAEAMLASFYMDSIAGKVKSTFFTELPKRSSDLPTRERLDDILADAGRLCTDLSEVQMGATLYRFYFRIFLSFDFIFSRTHGPERGLFCFFEPDVKAFFRTKKYLSENSELNKVLDSSDFRFNCLELIPNVIKQQVFPKEILSADETIDDVYTWFYEANVSCFENKAVVPLEPVGYYLSYKLWRISQFMRAQLKGRNFATAMRISSHLKDGAIDRYFNDSFYLGKEFYKHIGTPKMETIYYQMYRVDLCLTKDFLFEWVIPVNSIERKTITPLPILTDINDGGLGVETIEPQKLNHNLRTALDRMVIQESYNDYGTATEDTQEKTTFRFNMILKNPADFDYLLDSIATFGALYLQEVKKCGVQRVGNECNFDLVGIYKSGALLAHCLNIMKPMNRAVYLFTTYPYVALNPISIRYSALQKTFFLVDENYKTGFTTDLAQEAITTLLGLATPNYIKTIPPKFKILTLADAAYYEKLEGNKSLCTIGKLQRKSSETKVDIESKIKPISDDIVSLKQNLIAIIKSLWKKTEDSSRKPELVKSILTSASVPIKEKILGSYPDKFDPVEYDVGRVLSDSMQLFSVACWMWKVIKESNDNGTYLLTSGSNEGKLLAEAIALCARVTQSGDNCEFLFTSAEYKNTKNKELIHKIYIDSSINKAVTVNRHSKRSLDGCVFDQIVVIFASKFAKDKYGDSVHCLISEQ